MVEERENGVALAVATDLVDIVFQDKVGVKEIYKNFDLASSTYAAGSQFIECKFE